MKYFSVARQKLSSLLIGYRRACPDPAIVQDKKNLECL